MPDVAVRLTEARAPPAPTGTVAAARSEGKGADDDAPLRQRVANDTVLARAVDILLGLKPWGYMQSRTPPILPVDPRRPERAVIAKAAAALKQGGLVILPTDTVYGIAADPRVPGAVERLCEAKGREPGKPIPFLVDHVRRIRQQGAELSPYGQRLARRFWPGPLTLVLPAGNGFEGSAFRNTRSRSPFCGPRERRSA